MTDVAGEPSGRQCWGRLWPHDEVSLFQACTFSHVYIDGTDTVCACSKLQGSATNFLSAHSRDQSSYYSTFKFWQPAKTCKQQAPLDMTVKIHLHARAYS